MSKILQKQQPLIAAISFLFIFQLMNHSSLMAQIIYPVTKKVDVSETYFNTKVIDPYRWLEDDRSEETGNWVAAQNKITFDYLSKIPTREKFQKAIEEKMNYPKYGAPFRKGAYYYYYKNDGLQNQSVLYRQLGLDGKEELVIDPNTLSKDGTTRLVAFNMNKAGTYAIIGLSEGGSDWNTYYVRDMSTGQNLVDKLEWVKFGGGAWKGDGFFYSRYPAPDKSALSEKNENHMVYFHKVGTPQSADVLVYEDAKNGQRFHNVSTDEKEQYLFLYISDRGKGLDGNALHVADLSKNGYDFKPIISDISNLQYSIVGQTDKDFMLQTNDGAPNYKVVLVNKATLSYRNATSFIPEKREVMSGIGTGGKKVFVDYLKDVSTHTYVYDYNGKMLQEVNYPTLGDGGNIGGDEDDKELFYVFTSFTFPPTIYKYDVASGTSSLFRKPDLKFNPDDYVTTQKFYKSKDGTMVPMFIVHKKGIVMNGKNPTLLYGYGGFNVSLTPSFSAARVVFLDAGGVFAMANLRGGGEYGDDWHKGGMLLNKQNVFDDCIAGAEFLVKMKYCSSETLALQGGSNGGTLVGAVINQRPDLFAVALPAVGVMDMLRFHKFTIGWNWIADYGSSERSVEDFNNLYAYSPLHNLSDKAYPATLITTADHDDRVVPAHSFKYAAALQEKNTGTKPMLIRIDTNSGHGSSNMKKAIETTADIYAFMFHNMGLEPKL
jgi:prolyl oligopeptidase